MARATLGKVEVGDGKPVVIVGVLNLSPDSFYRGSIVRGTARACGRASEMLGQGAGVIDVGAMATGPGSKQISVRQELRELVPVVKALAGEFDAPISADTQRARVAEAAIEAGASIINDISGFKSDPRIAEVVAAAGCSAMLMATRHAPGDIYTIGEAKQALRQSLEICRDHGVPLTKVVVDPAVGHWPARLKRLGKQANKPWGKREYSTATLLDLRILAELKKLKTLGRPICVGISRKTFVGKVLNLPDPADRLVGSLAATAVAVLNGANVIRTHDVKETVQAVRMVEAVQSVKRR